ncbi:MAG: cation transporter [Simkania sp.]|nr:cation transporter [Simkania sp.]
MGHRCHVSHTKSKQHSRTLLYAICIAAFFMCAELVGGIFAKSLALISDALHIFADVGTLALSLFIAQLTQKPTTPQISYGFKRAEVLGALISTMLLWALCGVLAFKALERLFHPEEVQGSLVLIIATIGLFANIFMMKVLHPSHQDNLNMRAAYLHVIGDLLGSFGVLLSGGIIWLTGWNIVDPIVSLLFSLGIIYSSIKIAWKSICILMEFSPPNLDIEAIEQALASLPGVEEVHDLHVWSIASDHPALSVHLVAKDSASSLTMAYKILQETFDIHHLTIQIEDQMHFKPKYCYNYQQKN